MLTGFLDWYRRVVEHKVEGLSEADARRVMTRSGLSPLGVVKHLGWVERGWFQNVFAGRDAEQIASEDDDNSVDFQLDSHESVDSVVDFYRTEVATSRQVVQSAASLDDLSARSTPWYGHVSLRWILTHILEETARHAGHLDLMREEIDGRVGD